jgi:hypothetical protein
MKILNKSSENEMVALFLYEEIKSERWVNQINKILKKENINKNIIFNPDLNDNEENRLRKMVLKDFRGYIVI